MRNTSSEWSTILFKYLDKLLLLELSLSLFEYCQYDLQLSSKLSSIEIWSLNIFSKEIDPSFLLRLLEKIKSDFFNFYIFYSVLKLMF